MKQRVQILKNLGRERFHEALKEIQEFSKDQNFFEMINEFSYRDEKVINSVI